NDLEAEVFLKRRLLHNIGGLLVLWDSPAMRNSSLSRMAVEGFPVVDLLPDSPAGLSSVTPDRENAFLLGPRYRIDLGHRRIALISDTLMRPKTTLRKLAGYRRALEEADLDFEKELVVEVRDFGFEGGLGAYPVLMQRDLNVTAAICINDAIALGLIA